MADFDSWVTNWDHEESFRDIANSTTEGAKAGFITGAATGLITGNPAGVGGAALIGMAGGTLVGFVNGVRNEVNEVMTLFENGTYTWERVPGTANFVGGRQLTHIDSTNEANGSSTHEFRIGAFTGSVNTNTPWAMTLTGTSSADTIRGKDGANDVINGGGGNDRITGHSGNDVLRGGDGDDFIFGGGGRDRLEGGAGRDTMHAASGGDRLLGGAGVDLLYGGDGSDVFYYSAGAANRDRIYDFQEHDMLVIAAGERVISSLDDTVVNGQHMIGGVVLGNGTNISFVGNYNAGTAITAGDHANLWEILG